MTQIPIRRALLSVYDKTGLAELAGALHEAGAELVSTGNTATAIERPGFPVTKVEDLTGFPECLDGRVKTLHPRVHAGLLADTAEPGPRASSSPTSASSRSSSWSRTCTRSSRRWLPARTTTRSSSRSTSAAPRWSAPRRRTTAASRSSPSPAQYDEVLKAHRRRRLHRGSSAAASPPQAYAHTAAYDAAVSSWFAASYAPDEVAQETGWPDLIAQVWTRSDVLRYGENPHQRGGALRGKSTAGSGRTRPGRPWHRQRRGAARQGHVLQQLRRRRRRAPRGLRLRASRASRSSSTPTRAASRSAPTSPPRTPRRWPATRCPPTAAWSRPTAR